MKTRSSRRSSHRLAAKRKARGSVNTIINKGLRNKTRFVKNDLASKRKGGGLINTLINKLPIELHLPGYR